MWRLFLFSCCHWSPRTPPGTNGASSGLLSSSDGPSWWRSATQRCGDTPTLPAAPSQAHSAAAGRAGSSWEFQTGADHRDDSARPCSLYAARRRRRRGSRPVRLSVRPRRGCQPQQTFDMSEKEKVVIETQLSMFHHESRL